MTTLNTFRINDLKKSIRAIFWQHVSNDTVQMPELFRALQEMLPWLREDCDSHVQRAEQIASDFANDYGVFLIWEL